MRLKNILIGALRTKEGFHPAYHMNKEQWISIRMDGSVPEQEIRNLIDDIKKEPEKVYLLVAHNGISRAVESYFTDMTNAEYAVS